MPVIILLGGTWTRKKSKFDKRPGPNKAVHGGLFSKKQCPSIDVYSALQSRLYDLGEIQEMVYFFEKNTFIKYGL